MLFSGEIEALHDDGFEGSMNELLTSRKVYFGNDGGRGSKRCLVTGVINFERDYRKDTDVSLCSNSGNSDITSQEDTFDVKEDPRGNSEPVNLSEDFKMTVRNNPDGNVKRMKLSVDNLLNSSAPPFKGVVSGVLQPLSSSVSHTVTCRLVESASHGVSCSCYLLKKHIEMDLGGDAINKDISKCRLSSLDGSEQKEIGASKAIASPVSQESSATKLLVASPSAIVAIDSGCRRFPKPRWKDSCFVELDESEMSLSRESKNDPRPLLRYHINRLLKATGWVIGRRKRSSKYNGIGEYVYRSPEGRPIREFRRAWILCGQNLFIDSNNGLQEIDGKQWTDLTQFWSDLSNTSTKIKELDNLETTTALADCWCLLDPFANLVFIDKMFSSLKAGKAVKAKRSLAIDSSTNSDAILTSENMENAGNILADKHVIVRPCGLSPVSDSALTLFNEDYFIQQDQGGRGHFVNFEHLQAVPLKAQKGVPPMLFEENCLRSSYTVGKTDSKYKDISDKERSSLDPFSLQVYESDSNSDQNALFEVPISTEDANLYGMSETASPDEDSNMSDKSSGSDKPNHNDKRPLRVIKKSNKSSEIKLSTLYQNNNLGWSSSCKAGVHDCNEDSIQSKSRCIPECFISNVRTDRNFSNSSLCSAQQQNEKKQSKCNKFHLISGDCKKLSHANYNNKYPDGLSFKNSTDDEGCLHVKCESPGSGIKSKKPLTHNRNGQKNLSKFQLSDDDLLISAIMKTKSFKSTTKRSSAKRFPCKSKAFRKRKSRKSSCSLLPRSFNRGGMYYMEGKWSALGSRTVLSWLINSGFVSLNEVIQYRNTKDDTVVKDGLVTWDGILCRCCDRVLSVSEFKSHSGFRLNRPCMNLFMVSGKPLTLCQLEAWSVEYKARKSATRPVQVEDMDQNDDSCGLCGGGGELICCDNCPSTFHQACLYTQELPEGSWYCSHCTCQICGVVVIDKEDSKSPGSLKCSQCEHKYHETCLKEKDLKAVVASDIWFCGESCWAVYSGLHSRVGLMNLISDGFSWTLLKCIHGYQKVHSAQRFVALKAECNIKLAVALTIMEECFLPMVDARTGIDMIPHVLYNWGSHFARLNYHGFYTMVLEKNDVLLSVASIRIHGATVAEMPLIATCSKYRRQGMCRHLMNAIEQMLRSLKVEKLVISAIPSLVETWTLGFGFEALENDERQSLNTINLMVFPGTVWLKKSLSKNQVAVEQRIGSCHESPSGTENLAESGAFPDEGHIIEPAQETNENLCTEVLNGGTKVRPNGSDNIQITKYEDEDLDHQFSKLSCEETAATLGGTQLAIVCHVDAMEVYSDKQLPLTEQQEESNLLQRNDECSS